MRETPTLPDNSVLHIGELEVHFYLREPSPDQWNAVGIIIDPENVPEFRTSTSSRMIVGVGSTGDEAIVDLVARFMLETGSEASLELESQRATVNVF